jgi:hypothetical protein
MTPAQQQFLPDNLMVSLDSCKNIPLVKSSENLYILPARNDPGSWFTPMLFFTLLLSIYVLLSLSTNRFLQNILNGLDWLLFFSTGFLGILLIFMWTGTDHSMTKDNYNLLWAWPTHFIMAFFINSRKSIVKKYFLFTGIGLVVLLLTWFFLPQQMNNALLPFVLLLIFRSVLRYVK